jgi:hypothetical protein
MQDHLLPPLARLTGLLHEQKRFTGENRAEFHRRLLVPLFTSLDELHEAFCELFLQFRLWIGEQCGDPMTCTSGIFWQLERDPEFERSFQKVKEEFCRQRRIDDPFRDALRADAQLLLLRIRWAEERHFLILLCHYFFQQGSIAPSGAQLDREIESVLSEGGERFWAPPSCALYEKLQAEKGILPTVRLLDSARSDLNQRYMNARLAFKRSRTVLHAVS